MFCFNEIPQTRHSQRIGFVAFFTKEGREIQKKEAIELLNDQLVIAYIKRDNGYVRGEAYNYHVCNSRGLIPAGAFESFDEAVQFANPSVYEYRGEKIPINNNILIVGQWEDGGFVSFDSLEDSENYEVQKIASLDLNDPSLHQKLDALMGDK